MNTFLQLETCYITAIDTLMQQASKRPNTGDEFDRWIHNNSKKIGTEAKRLMTRYIVDVTSDPAWHKKFACQDFCVKDVESWKKYCAIL